MVSGGKRREEKRVVNGEWREEGQIEVFDTLQEKSLCYYCTHMNLSQHQFMSEGVVEDDNDNREG
jgi:hypothetical protein